MNVPPSRTALVAVLATALVAAASIPGTPVGLNFFLTGLFLLSAVSLLHTDRLRGSDLTLLCSAGVVTWFFVLRSAPWLAIINVLGVLGLATVATSRARTFTALAKSTIQLPIKMPTGFLRIARALVEAVPRHSSFSLRPALRGLVLGGLLMAVFGTLFLTADRAFASLAQEYLVPDWNVPLLPVRLTVALVCVALIGSLVSLPPVSDGGDVRGEVRGTGFHLDPLEWKTALILTNGLFVGFVAVQISVLFAGHAHVLETAGLTYSQYARQGFFQLIVVAVLTLGLISAAVRWSDPQGRDIVWIRALLGVLSICTLIVLASAFVRMNLYQEAFGFTRLRLLVDATILWLAGVFVLILVAGAIWNARWLPFGVVVLSGIALVFLNAYNPDARIAERNLARFAETGQLDVGYLKTLSADAVPELLRLPRPQRACVLSTIGRDLEGSSPAGFNLARARAATILRHLDLDLERGESSCLYL